MTLAAEGTTALRIHANLFDGESERYKDTSQQVLPNIFSQFILQPTTTSTSNVTGSHAIHFASFAMPLPWNGVMWSGLRR
jgi:hypothetical protein